MSLPKAPTIRSWLLCSPIPPQILSFAEELHLPGQHRSRHRNPEPRRRCSLRSKKVIFHIGLSELAPVVPDRTSSWKLQALKVILDIWLLVTTVTSVPQPHNGFVTVSFVFVQ